MSRLEATFAGLKKSGRGGLVAFVTAGDPDLERSADIIRAVDRAGADVIEVGVPFSDPVADGPIIQRASERALQAGSSLAASLRLVAGVRPHVTAPLVLFTYANPVFRLGLQSFAERAALAGVDGVLLVDVPIEESDEAHGSLSSAGIDQIFLISPTTTEDRIEKAAARGRGFLYAISRLGVTGPGNHRDAGETDGTAAAAVVGRIRAKSSLPVALGFGISTPDHVRRALRDADAAVVGSGLVRVIEDAAAEGGPLPRGCRAGDPDGRLLDRVEAHVRWLRTGCDGATRRSPQVQESGSPGVGQDERLTVGPSVPRDSRGRS